MQTHTVGMNIISLEDALTPSEDIDFNMDEDSKKKDFFKLKGGFDPNQPRNDDGEWGGGSGGEPKEWDDKTKEKIMSKADDIAKELGLEEGEYNIVFNKIENNVAGGVEFIPIKRDGQWVYVMAPKITLNSFSDVNPTEILRHEMRHIYQSKKMGFYANKSGIFWDNEHWITLKGYNSILNGVEKSTTTIKFRANEIIYNSLPWEEDAIKFAKQNKKSLSLKESLKDLIEQSSLIDLIKLPEELLKEDDKG